MKVTRHITNSGISPLQSFNQNLVHAVIFIPKFKLTLSLPMTMLYNKHKIQHLHDIMLKSFYLGYTITLVITTSQHFLSHTPN